jgi:transcription-repair coupling factor (superfamily II helicase)
MGTRTPLRIDLFDDVIDSIRLLRPETQRSLERLPTLRSAAGARDPAGRGVIRDFRRRYRTRFEGDPRAPVYRGVRRTSPPPASSSTCRCSSTHRDAARLPARRSRCSCCAEHLDSRLDEAGHAEIAAARGPPPRHRASGARPGGAVPSAGMATRASRQPRVFVRMERRITRRRCRSSPRFQARRRAARAARRSRWSVRRFLSRARAARRRFAGPTRSAARPAAAPTRAMTRWAGWTDFLKSNAPVVPGGGAARRAVSACRRRHHAAGRGSCSGTTRSRSAGAAAADRDPGRHPARPADLSAGRARRARGIWRRPLRRACSRWRWRQTANSWCSSTPAATSSTCRCSALHSSAATRRAPRRRRCTSSAPTSGPRRAAGPRDRCATSAAELLDLYARRQARKGLPATATSRVPRFEAAFPFEETADQAERIRRSLDDLRSEQADGPRRLRRRRLRQDRGRMRAAFVAVQAGKQVAVLVPTTLLAEQHYELPRPLRRLAGAHRARCRGFARGRSRGHPRRARQRHGRHRRRHAPAAAADARFRDLGLIIVDEEHRFGVRDKERLKALRAEVHVLTLTATPIPRTLNMALGGLRDLSLITTPPAARLAIKTFVAEWQRPTIREACCASCAAAARSTSCTTSRDHREDRRATRRARARGRIASATGRCASATSSS